MTATEASLKVPKTVKAPLSTFRAPPQHNEVLRVYDKTLFEQGEEDEPSQAAGKDKSSEAQSPHKGKVKASPPARSQKAVKTAGFKVKMADAEEKRKEDQKFLRERVDRLRQMREQRFERLCHGIFEDESLVMEVAGVLRNADSEEFRRKNSLYNDWSGNVYQNISDQLHGHLNPFNRSLRQSLRGTKSVDFTSKKGFQATCPLLKDPLKRNLRDAAEEECFHRAARTVLRRDNPHSMSAPDLQRTDPSWASSPQSSPTQGSTYQGMRNSSSSTDVTARPTETSPFFQSKSASSLFTPNQVQLPRGRCKATLEPGLWGQMKLQDTMYGHFAQICEAGPGFKCLIRSGANVFIPDEADGITAAGKLHTRLGGFNDVGILKGQECSRGESIRYKMDSGSSTGAPLQDHFTYDTSTFATNMEFPPGKKVYPHMH